MSVVFSALASVLDGNGWTIALKPLASSAMHDDHIEGSDCHRTFVGGRDGIRRRCQPTKHIRNADRRMHQSDADGRIDRSSSVL